MADMSEIEKRFDIHEIAKNKNQDLERYQCNIYCCHKQIHYMIKKYMQIEEDEVSCLNPQGL